MSRRSNYLDAPDNAYEQNLRFVRNDFEDNLNQYFGGNDGPSGSSSGLSAPPRDYKLSTPKPGFCIKTFKVNDNEKYFINVCISSDIPPPVDLNEEQLAKVLESDEPSSYRIPMSISDPRSVKDKSNNSVDACDIAIHPEFYAKLNKSKLFRDFFMALVSEALNEKYNVQIKLDKAIILNNRKFIGTLVQHRVRNASVDVVRDSDTDNLSKLMPNSAVKGTKQMPLVQEVNANEANKLKKQTEKLNKEKLEKIKREISLAGSTEPEYKLRAKVLKENVEEIHAEFFLPKCITSSDFTLDIGDDRIYLESMKYGYLFDKFVNYQLKAENAKAFFDKTNKMLQMRVPVVPAK